jgi:N-methylhydantoinase A
VSSPSSDSTSLAGAGAGGERRFVAAIDTGGTFTDCVAVGSDGALIQAKVSSTPPDFSIGIVDGFGALAAEAGVSTEDFLSRLDLFLHGSTVVTNLLVTDQGSPTGVLTTRGHRDVLQIMGGAWGKVEGVSDAQIRHIGQIDKPAAVVPKSRIAEVSERVDYKGAVVVALQEDEVRSAVTELVDGGAESFAVCFLWSFKNEAHERRARELVEGFAPGAYVSISSEVVGKIGEYPRFSTTAVNARCGPQFSAYLLSLQGRLRKLGARAPTLIMQSTGGVVDLEVAMAKPYQAVASGPVGGLVGAIGVARLHGYENVICSDMGGTSFDVGLIIGGGAIRRQASMAGPHVVYSPSIDVTSVGAGGGSIAWVDRTGALRVGPQSAGAAPGPACYGRGGTHPTVTDADLLLGYLNPDGLLGGALALRRDLAEKAVEEHVAEPLGMTVEEAAAGIARVVDAQMADCMRQKTIEAGHDPRQFVAFAYGGAGPLHCGQYARDLGVEKVLIPLGNVASVFSAFGIGASPVRHVEEMTAPMPEPFTRAELEAAFAPLEATAREKLERSGFSGESQSVERFADIKFRGQFYELELSFGGDELPEAAAIVEQFHRRYDQVYGKGAGVRSAGVEVVNVRVVGEGFPDGLALPTAIEEDTAPPRPTATRRMYWPTADEWAEAPIYSSAALTSGVSLEGPLVVEGTHTSVVVHPGDRLEVLERGTVSLSIEPEPGGSWR